MKSNLDIFGSRTYAEKNHHYCYALNNRGLWMNQGMVPDNNRERFITEYKSKGFTRCAFVPFCVTGNNLLSDSQIYSYAEATF